MSSELLLWAARQRTGSPAAKAVLYALCDINHHVTGPIAWPSIATLADHAEVNRKTVIVALAHLTRLGLIVDTGQRHGRTKQVVEWLIGPERVPELGLLGDHAGCAKIPENGTLTPAKSPTFSTEESQKRDTNLSKEPKKEARARAPARDPVDNGDRTEDLLGEGLAGLQPSTPGTDPAPVIVGATWNEWLAMERRYGLPGPIAFTVAREKALIAKLREVGSDAVAAVIATTGWDHARPRRRPAKANAADQADWLTMFDQVFEARPEYRGLKLFERLLALPAALLEETADDDPAETDPAVPTSTPATRETVAAGHDP